MDTVIDYAVKSGASLWAVVFIAFLGTAVVLVRWVLKTNNDRENRYITVIDNQAKALGNFTNMREDVADIKRWLEPKLDRR
jgi:hypothetical protein